ncbi:MAG: HAD family hydrolase [Candidatus Eremiobacteraeota bacterium]|nr:HAD family hydrolase [Candidatus Eremiobacteraeota bacterium]
MRSHYECDRRGHDRLVRDGDALLRDAERTSRPAQQERRQGRRDRLQDRRARGRSRQRPSARAALGRRALESALRVPLARSVRLVARSRNRARVPRRTASGARREGRALLLDVRTALLLDEDHARSPRVRRKRNGRKIPRVPRKRRRSLRVDLIRAVLFDRDETLVVDVPFNGDPERVEAAPNARAALDRLRAAGLKLAVVSNQSGVGRGLLTMEQVDAVNRRVDELLGPFDGFFVCPHSPDDACECRKPKPKLIRDAALALNVDPGECIVVGDRDSDIAAAHNAGAEGIKIAGPAELEKAAGEILLAVQRTMPSSQ